MTLQKVTLEELGKILGSRPTDKIDYADCVCLDGFDHNNNEPSNQKTRCDRCSFWHDDEEFRNAFGGKL